MTEGKLVLSGIAFILHVVYVVVWISLFWNRMFGHIYVWEDVMLYVYIVLIPMGVILLIAFMIYLHQ